MVKRKRHKPPSRLRYEASHPVVSFRVKQDLYDRFKEVLKRRDQSAAMFFKDILEEQHDIFSLGKLVKIPCAICGEPMTLNIDANPAIKETLKETFSEWCHVRCEKAKQDQLSPIP